VTQRIDVASSMFANGFSLQPQISSDAQLVVFSSLATNLVAGVTGPTLQVFLRDRLTGQTTLGSASSTNVPGNGASGSAVISADRRILCFASDSTNLVGTSTSGITHVYVRDLVTGVTQRISVTPSGAEGNGSSFGPAVSGDGRHVVFHSTASNLVSGDTNNAADIFAFDRFTQQMRRVSQSAAGTQGNGDSFDPAVSSDGRFVAFSSEASNLLSGDTNGKADIFVWDRTTSQVGRVSLTSGGAQGNGRSATPAISQDGRFVAFDSDSTNLVSGDANGATDVFLRDRSTNQTTRMSLSSTGGSANAPSFAPTISGDARIVAFTSEATNLTASAAGPLRGIYLRDRSANLTTRADVTTVGAAADGPSDTPKLSTNGRAIAFQSSASNLPPGGLCHTTDIFVRDLVAAAVAWKTGIAYAVGTLVTFNSATYECVQSHTSQPDWSPPNAPTLWRFPTPCGVQPWGNRTRYLVGSLVTFGGKQYRCIEEHTSQIDWTPPVVPALWQVVS
jgi:Tol biopolymer transport system component